MSKEHLPHQQRVVEELEELTAKLDKLWNFIYGEVFKTLSIEDQNLLTEQASYMVRYVGVLVRRINKFY